MNRKGFTLVELLAVIVLLGIILIIAVPKFSHVVKESDENLFKTNSKLVLKEILNIYESEYKGSLNTSNVIYNINNGKVEKDSKIYDINLKDDTATGRVEIDNDGNAKMVLKNDKYCVVKEFNNAELQEYDSSDSRCQ